MNNTITRAKNIAITIILFSSLSTGCTTMGKIWDVIAGNDDALKQVEKLKETQKKLEEFTNSEGEPTPKDYTGLKIALIPFDYTTETGYKRAKIAHDELASSMVLLQAFKPYSLKEWSSVEFGGNRAKNVQEIITTAQKKGLAIDFIAHGHVFKSGKEYGLVVSLYPLIPGVMPSYYFRPFKNFYSITNITDDIVKEMEKRFNNTQNPKLQKHIFVHTFKINYYTFTNISSDEGSTISLPYIKIKNVSYKSSDHFFNELLLYNLHATRLFTIMNANMNKLTRKSPTVPSNTDYIINATVNISRKVSLMKVQVIGRKKNKSFSYSYPFNSLELEDLSLAMKENVKIITLRLLSSPERKKVGVANLSPIDSFHQVFCENYYLGHGSQNNLVLPVGTSSVYISDDKYKLFVSPHGENNNKIYRLKNAFLLNSK